ncbi:unnamed protein product [Penicillium glandicola]
MENQHSPFANEEYTVGWICALPVELAAAKGMLDEVHGEPQTVPAIADHNTYILGCIKKFKVVVACLPVHELGSAAAAAVAKDMLFTFPNIRIGLLVGIGAGIPDDNTDIRLGDVVISSDAETGGAVVYDFGKRLADGSFKSLALLNRPPRVLRTALGRLRAEHEMRENKIMQYIEAMLQQYPFMRKRGYMYPGQSADRLFHADYQHVTAGKACNECSREREIVRDPRFDENPAIHYGTIASGNVVVKNASTRDAIGGKHGAICLEMEAAGLMNSFPCVVIRGISDYADSHKNDHWRPFATAAAAACAKELLEYVQAKAVDGEPPAKDILKHVEGEVSKISRLVIAEQAQKILDWITPLDFRIRHSDIITQRQKGTGQWLLHSSEFEQWLSKPQTLFCPGIPGAGKTVMASIVVEFLNSTFHKNPEVSVMYLFCSHQSTHTQTTLDLLLSLLRQLAFKDSAILPNIAVLYNEYEDNKSRLDAVEVVSQLSKAAGSYEKIFIVIDALDEHCSSDPEELQKLLSLVFDFQKQAPVHLFATSRFNSRIACNFEGCMWKEIRAHEDDILSYVNSRMSQLVLSKISAYPTIQNEVRAAVVKSADGIVGELEEGLSTLPHGTDGLGMAYDQAIRRIKSQSDACQRMAIKVLSWLTCSKRVLYATELQHALGTRPDMKELDKRFLPPIEIIDSLCAGLVMFDTNSGVIRLVHHTTYEYLIGSEILFNAEVEITRVCITYLSFHNFSDGRPSKPAEYNHRQELYPLYDYCARNWVSHALLASAASDEIVDALLSFLDQPGIVRAVSQTMMSQEPVILSWTAIPRGITKLHLAAAFGLSDIMREFARRKEYLDVQDSDGDTPLQYAVRRNEIGTVRTLLESGQVNPRLVNQYGQRPIWTAVCNGNETVVKLLIDFGANVDCEEDGSLLHIAAVRGHVGMMRLLIDRGACLDCRCNGCIVAGTCLMVALRSDNPDAVYFLLDKGADPDCSGEHGDTLFSIAASDGNETLVRLLLERGVRIEPLDNCGRTPLALATRNGHLGIVNQLLAAGIKSNVQDGDGETPLMEASSNGFVDIAASLLKYGAHPNTSNNSGITALMRASQNGSEDITRTLLESESDVNIRDEDGDSALYFAVYKGHAAMVEYLLQHNADPNFMDTNGETVLSYAVEYGYASIVECLLQHKADPTFRDEFMETLLFPAAHHGDVPIAEILIAAGLDVSAQDIGGNTALFFAAARGYESMVRLFLAKGVDIHHRNALQETAIFLAAQGGHVDTITLLLSHGAECDPRNQLLQTPLLYAATKLVDYSDPTQNHSTTVAILLEHGAHPDPPCTPTDGSEAWELFSSLPYHLNQNQGRGISSLLACALPECNLPQLIEFVRRIWNPWVQDKTDEQVKVFMRWLFSKDGNLTELYPLQRKRWKDPAHGSPLFYAIQAGSVELVTKLLKGGASLNARFRDGRSLVHIAADQGHHQLLGMFLNEDSDLELNDRDFVPLILSSTRNEDITTLKMVLDKTKISPELGGQALVLAATIGNTKIVKLLLDKGSDPHLIVENGDNPLHLAAERGHPEIVEILIQQNADVNLKDSRGRTPLYKAVFFNHVAAVQQLLQAGADPNTTEIGSELPEQYGQTPLFSAALNGDDSVLKLLLDYGADADCKDSFGETPLCRSAEGGWETCVKMLLDKGANATHKSDIDHTPMMWVFGGDVSDSTHFKISRRRITWSLNDFSSDKEAVTRMLLDRGADPNTRVRNGRSILSVAAEDNSISLVTLLLERGADPNVRDRYGRTPLMDATVRGSRGVVSALLESPTINRDITDEFGRTALIEASKRGETGILSLLSPEPQPFLSRETGGPEWWTKKKPCDVCRAKVPETEITTHGCSICNFHICKFCDEWGVKCPDDTHPRIQETEDHADSDSHSSLSDSPESAKHSTSDDDAKREVREYLEEFNLFAFLDEDAFLSSDESDQDNSPS